MKEYKRISNEILELLKANAVDEDELEVKLDQRQEIINKLSKEELQKFRATYKREEVDKLDQEIKMKLQQKVFQVRKELIDYRAKKAVNIAYANINKTNLNIFSKKV